MIIWGSKGREIDAGGGRFFCPQCTADRDYRKLRVARYFTLYFVPLFETAHLGDFVRCLGCRGEFRTGVLDLHREPPPMPTTPWACGYCGNRNPPDADLCLGCHGERSRTPPPLPPADLQA